jgi:hypothetical protein
VGTKPAPSWGCCEGCLLSNYFGSMCSVDRKERRLRVPPSSQSTAALVQRGCVLVVSRVPEYSSHSINDSCCHHYDSIR